MDLRPGTPVSGYTVVRRLARGGIGVVYLVRDTAGALHALKLLRHADPGLAVRLRAEGRLQAALDHPNLVRVTDTVEVNGLPGLVMDYVPGPTLARFLEHAHPLSISEIDALGRGLLRGIAAAHAAGRVHRDLKPDNVLLALDGDRAAPRVTDFGLAAALDPDEPRAPGTLTRHGAGTRRYMSLEQLTGAPPSPSMDVFALGAVLYELVEGAPAFGTAHAWHEALRIGRYPLPARPDVPARMRDAIRGALADRERRAPDAAAVLARWVDGTPEPKPFRPETLALIALAADHPPPERLADGPAPEHAAHLAVCPSCREEVEQSRAPAPTVDPGRLGAERDAFVGRQSELAALAARFAAGDRLITVHGAAGIGKSRLALRFARSDAAAWPGGVWPCDLSEARDADGIVHAVGRALGLLLDATDPAVRVGHAIAGRGRCLLVLDNFEQVVRHAEATVGAWSARAPEARFLVTSRVVLGIRGEQVLPVEPLRDGEAAALFVLRAGAADPSFDAGAHADDVRRLVALLDGLPLGIELCAARVRVMTPAALVERMGDRFRVLAGGREGPGRHTTLRAALDGSWELLAPWERAALSRCAVFAGGFDLAAADRVLDLSAWPEAPWVVDVVQALADASLVRRVGDDRFDLLLSVRDYAAARLGADEEPARRRHAEVFADRADAADRRSHPLARELDNLLAAHRWAAAAGDGDLAARTALGAAQVLEQRGLYANAERLLREVRGLALPPLHDGRTLLALGRVLHAVGRAEARACFDGALAAFRAVGASRHEAEALGAIGGVTCEAGNAEAARPVLEEALALFRAAGDRIREARTLGVLAHVEALTGHTARALEVLHDATAVARDAGAGTDEAVLLGGTAYVLSLLGRHAEAAAHSERAIARHRELGNRRHEAREVTSLAAELHLLGRVDEAIAHYRVAAAIHAEIGDRRSEGGVVCNVGSVLLSLKRYDEAEEVLQTGLALARETGNRRGELYALANLGLLYAESGRRERAPPLLDRALAAAREIGWRRDEGMLLGRIAHFHAGGGAFAEAFAALDDAERILAELDDRRQLAGIACIRATACARAGDPVRARAALASAEALAAPLDAAPGGPLGQLLAEARAAVGADPPR